LVQVARMLKVLLVEPPEQNQNSILSNPMAVVVVVLSPTSTAKMAALAVVVLVEMFQKILMEELELLVKEIMVVQGQVLMAIISQPVVEVLVALVAMLVQMGVREDQEPHHQLLAHQ
jgi:hypothetical protein